MKGRIDKFQVGRRVVLTKAGLRDSEIRKCDLASGFFKGIDLAEWVKFSPAGIAGTIVESPDHRAGDRRIWVRWDNGRENSYASTGELRPAPMPVS